MLDLLGTCLNRQVPKKRGSNILQATIEEVYLIKETSFNLTENIELVLVNLTMEI